jgi:hypothetical protein
LGTVDGAVLSASAVGAFIARKPVVPVARAAAPVLSMVRRVVIDVSNGVRGVNGAGAVGVSG